ncbi:MAG TPA: T9SS type A sorting domain-containing protein, partial [Flavobacteriales bacterium]|nr:T9SS type A sorting domain-containing protein [Flavobacteriales bacterium]
ENTANIFFDFNPPVITEPSVLTAEFSTGAEELEGERTSISPNPTSTSLFVRSNGAMARVLVVATDGRTLMSQSVRSSFATLDVSGLPSGLHVLVVEWTDGTTSRERFIKQ